MKFSPATMSCRNTFRFFEYAFILFALIAGAPAIAGDQSLSGCWQGERVVQYLKDGSKNTSELGRCFMRIQEERMTTRCRSSIGEAVIEYTYRVVRPGTYVATLASHSSRPDLVGSTREYDYRIADERLFITTNPQTTSPAPPTAAVRVESVSVRASCP